MGSIHDIHHALIEQCKAGVRSAQKEVYSLYAKNMYNICVRILNNKEEAHDLLQDSFVEAFTKLDRFRFESSFGTWLKQIVVNRCINAKKKRKLDYFLVEEINDFEHLATSHDSENNEEELMLSVERIKKALLQLPEGARIVFSLNLFEGYDYGEISEILGITESTVKTQFMKARNRIKQLMEVNE